MRTFSLPIRGSDQLARVEDGFLSGPGPWYKGLEFRIYPVGWRGVLQNSAAVKQDEGGCQNDDPSSGGPKT